MKRATSNILFAAFLLAASAIQAQQAQSSQPPQAQVQHAPCGAAPAMPKPPKWFHPKLPPSVQKAINQEQAKLNARLEGGTIDINGVIRDATDPKPCQPAPKLVPPPANPQPVYIPQ